MTRLPGSTIAWTLSCLAMLGGCGAGTRSRNPTDPAEHQDSSAPRPGDAEHGRIHGHLLGHDGEPITRADLHLHVIGEAEVEVPVAADGEFTIEVSEPSWAQLRMTGVDHADHSVEFFAASGDHELEIRLGTYSRPAVPEGILGFGRFDGEGGRVNLAFHRRDDGAWVATLRRGDAGAKAKEFHYQIANATSEGRTINGTRADRYLYDGGGDYFSVITLGDATEIELIWDPNALPPSGQAEQLRFAEPRSLVARSAQLYERLQADHARILDGVRAELMAGSSDDARAAFARAQLEYGAELVAAADAESDPELAKMLWVEWAETLEREPDAAAIAERGELARRALTRVGPHDPVWSMHEWAMATVLLYVDDPQYFAIAAAEHPDPTVAAALWILALIRADAQGSVERGQEAMVALADPRYADVELLGIARSYDPDRPTAPGRQIPAFEIVAADGRVFSAAGLLGKTYVLDFWATWCGPCIAEMPALHASYAALNHQPPVEGREYQPVADPELQLISISLDHDVGLVDRFRAREWPMPWAHAVPDSATHKQLSALFGISAIPTMILVGPDGTILASSPRLDGGSLGEIAGPH